MSCRCNERRAAIKQAWAAKSLSATTQAARFVITTMAEDAGRKLVRSGAARRK